MSRLAVAIALLVALAGPASADPVLGLWQTEPDEGAFAHVRMAPCDAGICGVIERTFRDGREYASENLGKMLVLGMQPEGGGRYAGRVWRPSNDRIYIGKIELRGDQLRMRGCVAGGLICSGQTWIRVE